MISRRLLRKAAGVLLAAVMLCCMQPNLVQAEANLEYAEEKQTQSIFPMYVQGNRCRVWLNFNGTRANCKTVIKGKSGTTKISGLIKLYDNTAGRQVTSWTVSESGSCYSGTKTATVKKGHSYTLSFSGKVYGKKNKAGESVSSSTSKRR